MAPPTTTIADVIDTLAAQTGASEDFVVKTQESFIRRGIGLHEPVAPYFDALIDAFERDERIRQSAARAHEQLEVLDGQLDACAGEFGRIRANLLRIQENLDTLSRRFGVN